MKKRILLILLLTVSVSGCVTIRIETRIKGNGSGTKSFVLALDKQVVSMFESMAEESGASSDGLWDVARADAESFNGATVEEYSDEESEGIKVTIPFSSLEELQALSGRDAFEEVDVVTVSQSGDTTTLHAIVNISELTSAFNETETPELEGFDLGEIEVNLDYVVEVEGRILEYSSKENAEVKGSRVRWDLTGSPAETVDLMVKWEPNDGPNVAVILLVAAALAGIGLVIAGVLLSVRSKRTSNRSQIS